MFQPRTTSKITIILKETPTASTHDEPTRTIIQSYFQYCFDAQQGNTINRQKLLMTERGQGLKKKRQEKKNTKDKKITK